MSSSVTVEERLISEAEFGLFHYSGKITKKKAKELEALGFRVVDSNESKRYPRLHKILWVHAKPEEYSDINTLNEKDDKYSFPQKLWIISMKSKIIY